VLLVEVVGRDPVRWALGGMAICKGVGLVAACGAAGVTNAAVVPDSTPGPESEVPPAGLAAALRVRMGNPDRRADSSSVVP
jgi:hypothetical protein